MLATTSKLGKYSTSFSHTTILKERKFITGGGKTESGGQWKMSIRYHKEDGRNAYR